MLISAFAALVMFAAPETTKAGDSAAPAKSTVEDKAPSKTCYKAKPSGSRLARRVCVTTAPKGEEKAEKDIPSEPSKPE